MEKNLQVSQKELVQKCISKGLSVIEGDAEKELYQFPKKSFDYVVLSQTLQAFFNPEEVNNNPSHYSERPSNSIAILSYLISAYRVTGKSLYLDTYYDLVKINKKGALKKRIKHVFRK